MAPIARKRGEDRFYLPPAMRKLEQQQVNKSDQKPVKSEKRLDHKLVESENKLEQKLVECENRLECDKSALPSNSISKSLVRNCSTNLDSFLEYTTPSVSAQFFAKTSMRGWRDQESELQPYFVLGDLWESFKEWSVYGAGVPLLLNKKDSVVQYYVPSLSGIQVYTDPSHPFPRPRIPCDESDTELTPGTSSDSSSDAGAERGTSDNRIPLKHKPYTGSSSDEGHVCSPQGQLTFEYLEQVQPFNREPLADKMSALASCFPELKTYRSCDLSPSSWISVAWYPIYRIPMGQTLQNLDACFLTFHSLATPIHSTRTERLQLSRQNVGGLDLSLRVPLPIFGLATYKYEVSVWNTDGACESQKVNSRLQAADNWLRLLQVNLPDYLFFVSRNTFSR